MAKINPKLIDVSHMPDGMLDNPSEYDLMCAGAIKFPKEYYIPKNEWADRIEQVDLNQSAALDFSARFTHQGRSHECVHHATTQGTECVYNRQLGTIDYAVYLSPLFGYSLATNGRERGGSNVMDALYQSMEVGRIPEFDGPDGQNTQYDKFLHTMHQTSGRSETHWPKSGWVKPRRFPRGYEQTAKHFKILEAWAIPNADAHMSALLHGFPIINGRKGHSICHGRAVKDGRKFLSMYRDSYNRDLYDSLKLLGGGFCITSVSMPDDPNEPTGDDVQGKKKRKTIGSR